MSVRSHQQSFYKLYFATSGSRPSPRIYMYYGCKPLYLPAVFDKDRYYFRLPRQLEEKMLAGELIADFTYAELPLQLGASTRIKTPCSIILSDRYE